MGLSGRLHPRASSPSPDPWEGGRLPSTALVAHVQVFLKHLFPICRSSMPLRYWLTLLAPMNWLLPSMHSSSRFARLHHIQLKLDGRDHGVEATLAEGASASHRLTGESLLAAAEEARRQYNMAYELTLDAVLSSFSSSLSTET